MKDYTKELSINNNINEPLDSKVFNVICIGGTILCIISAIQGYITGFSLSSILFPLLIGTISLLNLYFVYKTKKIGIARVFILFLFGFVLLPFFWFYNFAINGSILYYLPVFGISVVILTDGIIMVFFLIAEVLLFCSLIVYNLFHPNIYGYYSSTFSKGIDISTSFVASFICASIIVHIVYKEYKTTNKHYQSLVNQVNLKNKDLENKNQMLIEAHSQLKELSIKDFLTNTYNRMAINEIILAEMKNSISFKQPLAIIMIDLDYFKIINDTEGHLYGDEVLIKVSSVVKNALRKSDFLGRFGGEEFIAVLPNCNKEVCINIADRIKNDLKAIDWKRNIVVTISGGTSIYESGQTLDEFINSADLNLYKAKENGRNQFI